jgi:hypothetical protein
MPQLGFTCLVWICLLVDAAQPVAQAPRLTFTTSSGDGPGIYSPVSVRSDTGRIVVEGRLLLGETCRRLTAALAVGTQDTLTLELDNSRVGNFFCGRDETPVRYRAAISSVSSGPHYVRITIRDLGRPAVLLGAAEVSVPFDH